mgnify:CR=1 FL=1|jgi:homoserine dehydrogenase
MKKIKIGICGWGTVATSLHSSIIKNKNQIKRTHQVDLEIVAIGARRDNPKYNPGETKILRDVFDVLDEDIDVLVELIGGTDDAKTLISSAFKKKIPVVTANKAVIYEYGDVLFKEASHNDVNFLFEASVSAGTPTINLLKNDLAGNKFLSIKGMLNGTSNFIISQMEDGMSFEDSLSFAQENGYAEADPTFDIEGIDAAHKISILSNIIFGSPLPPNEFLIEGISNITKQDIYVAKKLDLTVKHISSADMKDGKLLIRSNPALVRKSDYLSSLKNVRNGLVIDTDLIGKIHISGSGAGGEATAAGVISDIVRLASESNNHNAILKEDLKHRQISDEPFSFLIIVNSSSENINSDVLDKLAEHRIPISNSGLINDGKKSDITCFYETEEIASIALQEFLNDLSNLSSNFKTLRIEK